MSDKLIVDNLFDGFDEPGKMKKLWWRICGYASEIRYFFRKIGQRITYGFPLEQSWDFHYWHSGVVVPRLKHLRDNLNGHPGKFESLEEWKEVLNKIIWAFENCENEPPPIYSEDYSCKYEVEKYEGMTSYTPIITGTVDYSPFYEHRTKIEEGLKLFGEYYLDLWD